MRRAAPACPPRRQHGAAYLGLLLFLAVFGAISAGVVASGAAMGRRIAEEELLFVGNEYRNAVKSYYEAAVGGRRFAPTLQDLLRDPRFPGVRRHLRRLYVDPLTGSDDWGIVQAPGGGIMGVYSKAAGTPIKTAQFPVDYLGFADKAKYTDWTFAYVPPGLAPAGGVSGVTAATASASGSAVTPSTGVAPGTAGPGPGPFGSSLFGATGPAAASPAAGATASPATVPATPR